MMRMRKLLHLRPAVSRQELALIAITVVWGATFLVVHTAVQHSGPLFFVGVRFLTAGAISVLLFSRVLGRITRRELRAGTLIGVTIFAGYGLQTYGLQTISSSTSAFITALYVPMVPLLLWVVTRKAPERMALVGVALAFGGLLLLAGPGASGLALGSGELATLLGAVAIAAEIILIGAFAGDVHVGRVTAVQLLVAGGLAVAAMPVAGEQVPPFSWIWLSAAVGMGAASCLIQVTMNWAQSSVSSTKASIIYAGEPVWGGVAGRIAGDRLPATAVLGAFLIVAGVVVSELKPRRPGARDRRTGDRSAGAELPVPEAGATERI